MAYLNKLVPQKNYKEFIPHFLFDEKADIDFTKAFLPSIMAESRNLSEKEKWDISLGILEHKKILKGDVEGYDVGHFSTDNLKDIRLLFRNSTDDKESRTIGSKFRVYSTGANIDTGDIETQSIDSGFLTSKSYNDIFQNALAATNLWSALYSIGNKAIFTKLVYKPESREGQKPSNRKYRTIGLLKEGYREYQDVKDIEHILVPAGWECDIEDPIAFFGKDYLDGIKNIFFKAKDMDEVRSMLAGEPVNYYNSRNPLESLELTDDEIDNIINLSNVPSANYVAKDKDFAEGKAEGINLITTMNAIADIIDQ